MERKQIVSPQTLNASAQVSITDGVVGGFQQLSQNVELKVPTGDVQTHQTCSQKHEDRR